MTILKRWKKEHYTHKWASLDNRQKQIALAWLAMSLAPGVNIRSGTAWATLLSGPESPMIVTDAANPSVISTLHEVAHVLMGPSELLACVYSVKLFKEVFTTEFLGLKWHGHMLKKA